MDGQQLQGDEIKDQAVIPSETDVEVMQPAATGMPPKGPDGSITWTASEFVAHQKSPLWFTVLGIAAVILAAGIWLLTKDKVDTAAIIIAAIILGISGSKKPRELTYKIDKNGLQIDKKTYHYANFRSFAVMHQGAFSSLVFYPLKRFAFVTTAYYEPQDEEKIISTLSSYLPLEEKKRDIIDELMWKLKF